MLFSFIFDNHQGLGKESLYDITDAICGQLIDLGHSVKHHDGTLQPDQINVVVEGFSQAAIDQLKGIKARGVPLLIIATERPGKPGFNNDHRPEMIWRQKAFPHAAKEAAAVWCLVPGVAKWASKWCTTSIDLELGWSAARQDFMARKFSGNDEAAIFDFSFYGSLTPRRKQIIAEIERRGYLVMTAEKNTLQLRQGVGVVTCNDLAEAAQSHHPSGLITIENRNKLVAASKVVLGIHQFPGWPLVSNSRFATALSLGRPVINEPPPWRIETPWRKAGVFSRSVQSFADEAIAMLDDWQEARDRQVEAFRTLFPPAACVGRAIDTTLSAWTVAAEAA